MKSVKKGARSAAREHKVTEMAVQSAPAQLAVSLHPVMSFELRCAKDTAPQLNSQWRWSYHGSLHYIQILKASEDANEPGRITLVGGVFVAFNPSVADLPEATFLRNAFPAPARHA